MALGGRTERELVYIKLYAYLGIYCVKNMNIDPADSLGREKCFPVSHLMTGEHGRYCVCVILDAPVLISIISYR